MKPPACSALSSAPSSALWVGLCLALSIGTALLAPAAASAAETAAGAAAPAQASESTESESAHSATSGTPDSGASEPDSGASKGGNAPAPAPTGKPSLGLDRLLQPRFELPDQPAKSPTRDCNAWAARFDEARGEIKELELQISQTREKVAAKSGGAYQYSPLGGGETTSDPEVTKLRAQLKRDRESLEAGEKRLRELFVEADLAGVPRSCTEPRS